VLSGGVEVVWLRGENRLEGSKVGWKEVDDVGENFAGVLTLTN